MNTFIKYEVELKISHTQPHAKLRLKDTNMRHNDLKAIRSSTHKSENYLINYIRNRYVYKMNSKQAISLASFSKHHNFANLTKQTNKQY